MKLYLAIATALLITGCDDVDYLEGTNFISQDNKKVFIHQSGEESITFSDLNEDITITGNIKESISTVGSLHFHIEFFKDPEVLPKNISLQAFGGQTTLLCSECPDKYQKWDVKNISKQKK